MDVPILLGTVPSTGPTQTIQSNEVGGSYHMEQEGLARSLQRIQNFVPVDTLITDRHVSIKKYLRDQHPHIKHLFDIRHVAKGTKAAVQMEKIVCNSRLLKDIAQFSSPYKTSTVEAFHSLLNNFVFKMICFSFLGMGCRTALAALHFNENAHRAVTKDGVPVHGIHYPKYKKGGYIVRKVTQHTTARFESANLKLTYSCPANKLSVCCVSFPVLPISQTRSRELLKPDKPLKLSSPSITH
uniref:uncharacterized protein LOC113475719 isoform X2 n=1 Tax=Ciona intestinalis TaxID=7719 RepID=UPI000EF51AD6|nr:uncharacterized protein LOC113475719 isoform X2 [Ciona intestinalis]|eukprot:XP_026696159.1 uncharacterized protein LOC113475719 isoform X2 [Ciona intestinalis]